MDGSGGLFPYAPHLRSALEETHPNRIWQIGHLGMPGWTAAQMVQSADDPLYGLRHKLKQVKDPPISLVIILAGTNDLGYAYQSAIEDSTSDIVSSIETLHRMAHEQKVATLAVGIPTSRFQQQVSMARDLRMSINDHLSRWAKTTEGASYVSFPSDSVPDPEERPEEDEFWSVDGLHLTGKGYAAMGKALAEAVEKVLKESGKQQRNVDL